MVPEIASRHHLELIDAVVDEALGRAESDLEEVELVAATQGPGLIGALLVGLSTRRRSRPPGSSRSPPSTTSKGTWRRTSCAPTASHFEPPFVCLIASGGHTLLACVAGHNGWR